MGRAPPPERETRGQANRNHDPDKDEGVRRPNPQRVQCTRGILEVVHPYHSEVDKQCEEDESPAETNGDVLDHPWRGKLSKEPG